MFTSLVAAVAGGEPGSGGLNNVRQTVQVKVPEEK
jgi:hypothetical protein